MSWFFKVCRRSWLGLWNSPNPPEPESRDEIKVKDFMMQKYDRKTWYIPPSQLPPASPKTEASQSLPERKPLKHLLGEGSPTLVVGQEVFYFLQSLCVHLWYEIFYEHYKACYITLCCREL